MKPFKKLTTEIKKELLLRLRSKEVQDFVSAAKAADDAGTFEVIVSTADVDRQEETIDQSGWVLDFYRENPVVLWAHDYYSLPIGISESIEVQDGKLVARGKFASAEANPFAQQVRKLYDEKVLRATSVGFIPIETEGGIIKKAELLEFSFVPVPANPYALSLRKAQALGLDTAMLALKGITLTDEKGAVPFAETPKAPEDREWDGARAEASLRIFASSDGSGEPDTIDWEKYAKGFAWFDSENRETFGAYKLPHHEVIDGELQVVWAGVAAAMAALMGSRGGVDIPETDFDAVYSHLAEHYAQFEKEPPEKAQKEPQEGDPCTMDDGTEGELHPNDGGTLVCMPKKSKSAKSAEEDVQRIGAILVDLQSKIDALVIEAAKAVIDIVSAAGGKTQSKSNAASTGGRAEESRNNGTPTERSNDAGSDLMQSLAEYLNSPEREMTRQVLRIINNASSAALQKFNERARSKK